MMTSIVPQLEWDAELLQRYNLNGPRYTSYPTAPQFSETINETQWFEAVERSNASGRPLSLYFHIPFCDTVCYYCACNKVITGNRKHAQPYVERMIAEMQRQAEYIDRNRPVEQLHWGGGTPTYLSDDQKRQLMTATKDLFTFDDNAEVAIEIHPNGVTPNTLALLKEIGFNRLSMGVQDFDPRVQKAVNRFNTPEEVGKLVTAARELEFDSLSLDLIYGLPHQNCETLSQTLDTAIALSPDRLSLFNYAHMPHLFKVQKQIDENALPEPSEKLAMLELAIGKLQAAGYVYIGMDHFAKPEDELALAQQKGVLHRNFQGYTTGAHCDLFSFGVSSIAMIDDCYFQNHKVLDEYSATIDKDLSPITKGIQLTDDDLLRRSVIMELICNFSLVFSAVEKQWGDVFKGIKFKTYFENSLMDLAKLEKDGLVTITESGLEVLAKGRLLIRRICMAFDFYLEQQRKKQKEENGKIIGRSSQII